MSFFASLNGQRVTAFDVWFPYYGTPVADVATADVVDPSGPATLTIGNLTLAMTVVRSPTNLPRSGDFAGSGSARLVGGTGGWPTLQRLMPYAARAGVKLSTVLTDAARAAIGPGGASERVRLAAGLDRSLGPFYVPQTGAPCSMLLRMLAGREWWIDAKGITQIAAARPLAPVKTPASVTAYDPGKGVLHVATEDPAGWLPGATYRGPTVPQGVTVVATRIKAGNDGLLRVEALTA